jgi:hypothetical protein
MFVAWKIEKENMEISCTLIFAMENGSKYIIFFYFVILRGCQIVGENNTQ